MSESLDRILAIIPARGGSKGLPGKNVRDLAGLPLLAHSIQCARLSPQITRTIVSTDSERIAEVARLHGADIPFLRPAELATDTAATWPVIRHALAEVEKQEGRSYDAVLLLEPTTPCRLPADIENALARLATVPAASGVVAVSEPDFSPFWECVVEREGWMVDLFAEYSHHNRRQDVPTVCRINGCLYLWRAKFVREETESWRNGRHLPLVIPELRATHIDDLFQFQTADLMIRNGLIDLPWIEPTSTVPQSMSLANRRALVVGGAGHIGRAAVTALKELGAKVVVGDLTESSEPTGADFFVPMDLRMEEQTRTGLHQAVAKLGGLDILIHAAALVGNTHLTGWSEPLEQQSLEAWDNALRINLTSAFVLVQEARKALTQSGRGSVIFIGSIYGALGPDYDLYQGTAMQNPVAYGASKGGLLQLTRYFGCLLAPEVRVNMLSPGGIFRGQPESFVKKYEQRTPLRRMATEADLKGGIAYLASDMSRYVTGQNLLVDGGWSAW